ncbi:MAG: flavin reductase family protein [Clostridia bacterium]|nr:flavin reductase family protein [Clostridia bacterium]
MKKWIDPFDYANHILRMLKSGVLLNTQADRFNSMVLSRAEMGLIWGMPTFTAHVRQSRFSREQLDRTGVFTVSIPLSGELSPEVLRVCGELSGWDTDKMGQLGLLPAEPVENGVPGLSAYPLTLECRVLFRQALDLTAIPEEYRLRHYSRGNDSGDFHVAYTGQIVSAYILE